MAEEYIHNGADYVVNVWLTLSHGYKFISSGTHFGGNFHA